MFNIVICGVSGRMGTSIRNLLEQDLEAKLWGATESNHSALIGQRVGENICSSELAALAQNAQAVIDFTHPTVSLQNLSTAIQHQLPIVIGTTGFSEVQKQEIIKAAQKIPICFSPNMSVGVNVLFRLIADAAHLLGEDYDIEVIEAHHRLKKDAPSGTAMKIADVLLKTLRRSSEQLSFHREGMIGARPAKEIGMQTIRGGDIVGDHTVLFAGIGERLEITHRATNRDNFARGAILAAKWLVGKKPGLYDMQDVLGLNK